MAEWADTKYQSTLHNKKTASNEAVFVYPNPVYTMSDARYELTLAIVMIIANHNRKFCSGLSLTFRLLGMCP